MRNGETSNFFILEIYEVHNKKEMENLINTISKHVCVCACTQLCTNKFVQNFKIQI